jgi:hypothetical protein
MQVEAAEAEFRVANKAMSGRAETKGGGRASGSA